MKSPLPASQLPKQRLSSPSPTITRPGSKRRGGSATANSSYRKSEKQHGVSPMFPVSGWAHPAGSMEDMTADMLQTAGSLEAVGQSSTRHLRTSPRSRSVELPLPARRQGTPADL
mmetsp:Transcript_5779/g.14131  ORF Transcript_5779/g.14131 Transcript_5779/m.14131 type:complete len:115 (-) Transcript_5779:1088-1432(-)